MDETNNQSMPPMPQYPPVEEKGPFTLVDIIKMILAFFFIILILLSWFGPATTASGAGGLLMIMGIVTGISFLSIVISKTRHSSTIVRLFGILVGTVGGIFIFLVGIISGFIGSFRANPS